MLVLLSVGLIFLVWIKSVLSLPKDTKTPTAVSYHGGRPATLSTTPTAPPATSFSSVSRHPYTSPRPTHVSSPSVVQHGGGVSRSAYNGVSTLHSSASATLRSYGSGMGPSQASPSRTMSSRGMGVSSGSTTVPTIGLMPLAYSRSGSENTSLDGASATQSASAARLYTTEGSHLFSDTYSSTLASGAIAYTGGTYTNAQATAQASSQSTMTRHKVAGMYEAWVQKYRDYYGTDPTSTAELQAFIDWWLGQGLFAPEPDTDDDSGGPSSLYNAWLDKFYDYYGRYPNNEAELEEFIRWWQGQGVFTPDTPVGNGVIVLVLIALIWAVRRWLKTKTTY